jgi:hypothetical protein
MVAESRKSWKNMTHGERWERFSEILMDVENRRINEPVPKTCGEWWQSAGYARIAAIFAYSILETDGKLRPVTGDGPAETVLLTVCN